MQRIRLASVSYLNALPLTRGLTHERCIEAVEVILTPPAECARRLAEGLVDAALIPSIEFARIPGLTWIPATCVSSREEVRSVLLLSRVPPREIATLAVDLNSRTSVALAGLVLARRYGCRPRIESMSPEPEAMLRDHDAALLIGDPALRASAMAERGLPLPGSPRVMDLAREWHEMTRMPFVFALWACRPVVNVRDLSILLDRSLREGLDRIDDIAREESARTGIAEEVISAYLRHNIRYRLGPEESDSLRLFYRICREEGILPTAAAVEAARAVIPPGAADPPAARRP